MYKHLFQFICLLIVNIVSGRRLCYYPALHTLKLSKTFRRLLFVIDVDDSRVSVVGIIWQAMVVLTIDVLVVVCFFSGFDSFFEWYNIVSVIEWICVGVPLAVYSLISEQIFKKRGDL